MLNKAKVFTLKPKMFNGKMYEPFDRIEVKSQKQYKDRGVTIIRRGGVAVVTYMPNGKLYMSAIDTPGVCNTDAKENIDFVWI
jgi:hypothetical protein